MCSGGSSHISHCNAGLPRWPLGWPVPGTAGPTACPQLGCQAGDAGHRDGEALQGPPSTDDKTGGKRCQGHPSGSQQRIRGLARPCVTSEPAEGSHGFSPPAPVLEVRTQSRVAPELPLPGRSSQASSGAHPLPMPLLPSPVCRTTIELLPWGVGDVPSRVLSCHPSLAPLRLSRLSLSGFPKETFKLLEKRAVCVCGGVFPSPGPSPGQGTAFNVKLGGRCFAAQLISNQKL